jgi:hypothetical protein
MSTNEKSPSGFESFTQEINSRLAMLEKDMGALETENARLRAGSVSAFFERDACISLLAQMADRLGFVAGTVQNRVVVELPSGQVSWDFLEEDAHLFSALPPFIGTVIEQDNREIYTKVMNPGFTRDI